MTTDKKLIKNKSALLELANYLKNASEACQVMGYRRDTFYRVRKAYEEVPVIRFRQRGVFISAAGVRCEKRGHPIVPPSR